ncbi:MAG: hypothetical protein U9N34_09085, partial [Candidatus Cloacimonadota bacterium]|nr:hypothetical protein [Candidatus Cloacimonadota bacterium]
MLKKSLLVFGLASLIIVINAQIGIDFSQDISYETNIFRLSHEDITKFENGNSEFSFVKSRDDIIYNPSLEINYKFNFRKFSTNPSIKLSKNYYYNNSEKNSYAIYASVNNDLNFLHMNLSVGTNMNNYARDYADHDADNDGNFDNDVFQPYKYDKNMYKIYLYKRIYDIIPISYLKYEEYFYNKYFTEHDGNSLSVGFGTKFVFSNSYLKLFYEYRTFVTNNHNDFDTNVKPDYFRDSSFDSNKYSIELKTKKIDFIIKNAIRPKISYSFEQKFY